MARVQGSKKNCSNIQNVSFPVPAINNFPLRQQVLAWSSLGTNVPTFVPSLTNDYGLVCTGNIEAVLLAMIVFPTN